MADLFMPHAAINMSEINKDVGKEMRVDDAIFTEKLSRAMVLDYLRLLIYGDPLRSEIAETFTLDVVHEITECFIRTLQNRNLGVRARITGSATVTVIGDIHGNITGLRRILAPRIREKKRSMYVFLGDYVDKDDRGVEVMLTIMLLRLVMPKTCITLRGNHEDVSMNKGLKEYGFYNDCTLYYKDGADAIFNEITRVYTYLPLACVLNGSLFFVHGGLPEDIGKVESILAIKAPLTDKYIETHQMLWDDPDIGAEGSDYNATYFKEGTRGLYSMRFGKKAVDEFLAKTGYKCIIRGHQFNPTFPFFATPDYRVITVFSSVDYVGAKNDAAVLVITLSEGKISFDVDYVTYGDGDVDEDDFYNRFDDDDNDDSESSVYGDCTEDLDENASEEDRQRYYEQINDRRMARVEKRMKELRLKKEQEMQRDLIRSEMVMGINNIVCNNLVTVDKTHLMDDVDAADYLPEHCSARLRNRRVPTGGITQDESHDNGQDNSNDNGNDNENVCVDDSDQAISKD